MIEKITKIQPSGFGAGNSEAQKLAELGRILLECIPEDKKQMNPGKVMVYLAKETIRCAAEGHEPSKITTKVIHTDLEANPNQEPSGWLSPLWKVIETRFYPEIKNRLIERCLEMGLDVYPVLEKVDGKPASYRLSSTQIPENISNFEPVLAQPHTPHLGIKYKKDLSLQLSTTGRIFFQEGMKWTPVKRYSLLTWQLFSLVAAVVYLFLVALVLWYTKGPLTGQHVVLLAMGIGVAWWAYRHITGVWRLFEDRIIIAPDWMLAWKELGATVEITRSKNSELPSTIHVNRYSTTCPICGWMVKLEKGEPDFPRQIVGRCEEDPRGHVYSFDRSTRLGWPVSAISHRTRHLISTEI